MPIFDFRQLCAQNVWEPSSGSLLPCRWELFRKKTFCVLTPFHDLYRALIYPCPQCTTRIHFRYWNERTVFASDLLVSYVECNFLWLHCKATDCNNIPTHIVSLDITTACKNGGGSAILVLKLYLETSIGGRHTSDSLLQFPVVKYIATESATDVSANIGRNRNNWSQQAALDPTHAQSPPSIGELEMRSASMCPSRNGNGNRLKPQ